MAGDLVAMFKIFDQPVTEYIKSLLAPYQINVSQTFFSKLLPQNVKILFYLVIFLTPFLPLKFLYPYSKTITIILISFIVVFVLLVFAIFLGFFELLYI